MIKKFILFIVLFFVSYWIVVASWTADILEENPLAWDIINKYTYGWKWYIVRSIPQWQLDIYNELWIWSGSYFKMRTLNTLECNDNYWFCYNWADAWPFQINQIHWEDHKWSKYLVIQGRNAIKWWDLVSAEAIRNTLFKFQVKWVANRMLSIEKRFCYKYNTQSKKMYYQAYYHNGNVKKWKDWIEFRIHYATRAEKSYNLLIKYINP